MSWQSTTTPPFLKLEFTWPAVGPNSIVVATAADGESALDCIRRYRPDVVVLDLEMRRLNGIEVTKELAADPHEPGSGDLFSGGRSRNRRRCATLELSVTLSRRVFGKT